MAFLGNAAIKWKRLYADEAAQVAARTLGNGQVEYIVVRVDEFPEDKDYVYGKTFFNRRDAERNFADVKVKKYLVKNPFK